MKIDTSSYYPKSPLDDDEGNIRPEEEDRGFFGESTAADAEGHDLQESKPEPNGPSESNTVSVAQPEPTPDLPDTEAESVVTAVSTFLSWILVPLIMPVYGVMLAFGLSILNFTDFTVRLTFTLIVAAFNLVVPALLVALLKKFGLVQDIGLNGQKERLIPYMVCIACLVGTAIFMSAKGAPDWLVMFFYGGAVAGAIEVIVNFWWKISVHAAGMAGLVALLLHILMGPFCMPSTFAWLIVAIALSGLLGAARVWLGRHTVTQVLAGYAVGFTSVYLMMLI